jgi:predicted O-methyltransferase YrrM
VFETIVQSYLQPIPQPIILEIGTQTGTSLIGVIKLLPGSTGTAIDTWKESELVDAFSHNLRVSGLKERITAYKSDPIVQLRKMIQDQQYFHLVYIQHCPNILDLYTTILMSWTLLAQYGVMIINDYQFEPSEPREPAVTNVFEQPRWAIDRFLSNYKNSLKVIFKDWRVFIQKLTLE